MRPRADRAGVNDSVLSPFGLAGPFALATFGCFPYDQFCRANRQALTGGRDMVRPIGFVLGLVMAATGVISLAMNVTEASARGSKCVAKCAAYCNKTHPSGGDNSYCREKCQTRHHC